MLAEVRHKVFEELETHTRLNRAWYHNATAADRELVVAELTRLLDDPARGVTARLALQAMMTLALGEM
jgi:hypothetical protein